MSENSNPEPSNFIRNIINDDLKNNKNESRVHTRFPPEPNGYLHIGHAKSICLNFGVAQDYEGGVCNLRFDDTNPEKEDVEYTDSIQNDVKWLGFDWEDRLFYASDYYENMLDVFFPLPPPYNRPKPKNKLRLPKRLRWQRRRQRWPRKGQRRSVSVCLSQSLHLPPWQ